ncbi:MAG: dihydrofolate reductase [Oscillospiraceae bacterium]|nr:dihydrofolate reductase [Oscillospiraceae bacterium]
MNIIVAVYRDWGIGYGGTQPVVLAEDRQYFKQMTNGGTVIAGRRTYEDFSPQPLPNRRNIIISQNRDYKAEGAVVVHSVDELRREISGAENVFVVGGGSIYKLLLPYCNRAYVTKLDAKPESDTFFENLDKHPAWTLESPGETLESGGMLYSFNTYTNNSPEDM